MAVKKLIRIESKEKVAELYWQCLNMTHAQILDRVNEQITMFENCILHAILFDHARGKIDTLNTMLNRILGNPKDSIDIKAEVKTESKLDISKLSDKELESLYSIMKKSAAKNVTR